jgi:hypothetical protein
MNEKKALENELKKLELKIPSKKLREIIEKERYGYLIGKYEELKRMHEKLEGQISALIFRGASGITGGQVIYKRGLDINFEEISVWIAIFSISMSIFSYLMKLGKFVTAITTSIALASVGFVIYHRVFSKTKRNDLEYANEVSQFGQSKA